jgi:hypothetical protein
MWEMNTSTRCMPEKITSTRHKDNLSRKEEVLRRQDDAHLTIKETPGSN